MKYLLGFAVIVIAVVMAASLVLAPLTTNMEAQAERARADRIAQESRLEQARAETVTAKADAFSLKVVAMLPWAVLIIASAFVATMLIVIVFRPPSERMVNTLGQMPPAIGQRPMYFVQSPHETPEAFLARVTTQMRQVEDERLLRQINAPELREMVWPPTR